MSDAPSPPPPTRTLTAAAVEEVFMACLHQAGEDGPHQLAISGVASTATFCPTRVRNHLARIRAMLEELPGPFRRSRGGGWSFLNLCQDRRGHQWADAHVTMDRLVMLGIAARLMRFALDRHFWSSLPGGMPYVVFEDTLGGGGG